MQIDVDGLEIWPCLKFHPTFYIFLWINTILYIKMISRKKSLRFINAWNWPETLYEKDIYIEIEMENERNGNENGHQNWNNSSFVFRFLFVFFSTHIHQIFFFLLSFVNVDQLIALWTINFRFMWTFNFFYPSYSPFYVIKAE